MTGRRAVATIVMLVIFTAGSDRAEERSENRLAQAIGMIREDDGVAS